MVRRDDDTPQKVCDDRHRNLNWAIGVIFVFLTAIVTIGGWSILSAQTAALTAAEVASDLRTEQRRLSDYREQADKNMTDIKAWLKAMSEKQDRMNDMVQRIAATHEVEGRRKP